MKPLYKKPSPYFLIILLTLVSTFILWSPFILKLNYINDIEVPTPNFETVLKHWDGPLYIIPAKTLYNLDHPLFQQKPLGLSDQYFAAHLPLYPFLIRVFAFLFGYLKSMLTVTSLSSLAFFAFFYYFLKKLKLSENPLTLTIVAMFITPRFFVVRSVGSPEPIFMLFILASILYFIEKKYLLAGLLGGLAAMTKTPGLLLLPTYVIWFIENYRRDRKIELRWLWVLLIPTGLLSVFLLYWRQYGDFWAYFHSGDNIHLIFPPFSVFNFQKVWVSTAWLEEIIFLYFFYLLAMFKLYKKKTLRPAFYFIVVFFIATISVQHRDISRYSLPMLPLAAVAYEKFLTSKKFLLALLLLLPAVYLYAWNFMLYNVAPITDWTPFL